MASTPDEIIDAALTDQPEDEVSVEELERRANDPAPTIPACELWKRS